MPDTSKTVTACILVIGNEILSGRTKDANIQYLATELGQLGIRVMECRVIPDIEATVVATVNEVRAKFDYVFTTGGIGPTHDDITADCIAKAFGVGISEHPEAIARMTRHYGDVALFTPARRRMARVPHGGTLVDNPVSVAPGFQMENVFTFAGIPSVAPAGRRRPGAGAHRADQPARGHHRRAAGRPAGPLCRYRHRLVPGLPQRQAERLAGPAWHG
jgi:molybdenum cofactor synthesis domain-containing protein